MLIIAYVHNRPEGHREPRNEVGSLSPAEHLAGFEPGTFRFLFQCLNPLGHSPFQWDPTEKASKFLDYYLKPVMQELVLHQRFRGFHRENQKDR